MQILANNERWMRCHAGHASARKAAAAPCVEKMTEMIPPQQFQIPIQAAIGGKVIAARDRARAAARMHREVLRTAHHAQGKLLEKQKEGKKRCGSSARSTSPEGKEFIAAMKVDMR